VLFDGRPVRHPAALPGMRDRTVTVGAPTLEQRMIAWRVGWVVAPGELVNDVARVHIYNGLVPSGFAQIGTRAALLEQKVAATPMRGWGGEIADRRVRFVFSNEPVDRLALLGTRVRAALAAASVRT
jgi:aspartate/methionine/tyrosine aminotransferase